MIEDGSGCAHVYGSGGVVRKCLKLSSSEWQEICSLIDDVGEVIYIRGQSKVNKCLFLVFAAIAYTYAWHTVYLLYKNITLLVSVCGW